VANDGYEQDWFDGVNDGLYFWARAELFIAKKRRGEIKPSSFSSFPALAGSTSDFISGSRCWIEDEDGIRATLYKVSLLPDKFRIPYSRLLYLDSLLSTCDILMALK
jgi:hypothetical protein